MYHEPTSIISQQVSQANKTFIAKNQTQSLELVFNNDLNLNKALILLKYQITN
ncbi:20244_t:CDS:2 [Gigaspora margarita]|uniref:20244_t:CDS:1 n=1 Tax=Gigaspora margarita TaxID=4874 RepID=A0ABM8VXB0_GIGMA|nr:20244_t:CDS:2 [Gigaspora margarita]